MTAIPRAISILWDEMETPIYKVLTDGEHIANAYAREVDPAYTGDSVIWIYVDDEDGWILIGEREVEALRPALSLNLEVTT